MLDSCHTIIYVRGYAMTQGEIDETTADPFNGFNIGSTTYRATTDKKRTRKYVFESPVIRLQTDFGYRDVFEDGLDIADDAWDRPIPRKSIIVDRYYEDASDLFAQGEKVSIQQFAKRLSALVAKVRKFVCAEPANQCDEKDFRCYLVAHSMGGLVCRAFLQNPELDPEKVARCVDKFFTYATPHNGIEMAGLNVPAFLKLFDMSNFNQSQMADYLNLKMLYERTKRVDWLPESSLPIKKVFCMIGSNRADYGVAMGLSRTFVGDGSDGLVKIDNASVWGVNNAGDVTESAAVGYCYRSHSGWFGIVNSEESYQNLTRFLFGDVRVDVRLEVTEVRLPEELQATPDVKALYQFEALIAPRGKPWYLTRRVAEEDSVACRTHSQLLNPERPGDRSINLCSVFLANRAKVNKNDPSLSYRLSLGIRVPDYEVAGKFWLTKHFEGSYLFRRALLVSLVPPPTPNEQGWTVKMDWESRSVMEATTDFDLSQAKQLGNGSFEIAVEINSMSDDIPQRPMSPGLSAKLIFTVSPWNTEYTPYVPQGT